MFAFFAFLGGILRVGVGACQIWVSGGLLGFFAFCFDEGSMAGGVVA